MVWIPWVGCCGNDFGWSAWRAGGRIIAYSLFIPRHNHLSPHSIHPTNTPPLNLLNNNLALLQNRLLDVGDPFHHFLPTHSLDDPFRVLRIQLAALAINLLLLPEHFLTTLPVLVDEPDLLLDLADVLQRLQPLVLLAVAFTDGVEVLLGLLSSQTIFHTHLAHLLGDATQRPGPELEAGEARISLLEDLLAAVVPDGVSVLVLPLTPSSHPRPAWRSRCSTSCPRRSGRWATTSRPYS